MNKIAFRLVQVALFLVTVIGFLLAMQMTENEFAVGQTVLAIGIMLAGMISLGISFAVTIKEGR